MRDFDLLQEACNGDKVHEQTRTSTVYGRTEAGGAPKGGSARCHGERGLPSARSGAFGRVRIGCKLTGGFSVNWTALMLCTD